MNTATITPESLLRHEAFVLALARSLVRDPATADDVAQETWLAALNRSSTGDARGWLARIVKSRASNWRRGETRRVEREQLAARPETQTSSASEQEDLELQHRVVEAVLALDEPYRGVVIAVYYGGRSPQDVARERGVPASTVRSQLSRALDLLRARLDRERGSRGAWLAVLGPWVRRREVLAQATTAAATNAVWPMIAWSSSLVAIGVLLFALWQRFDASASGSPVASVPEPAAAASSAFAPDLADDESERETAPVEVAAAEPEPTPKEPELAALLRRMRQIKTLLLERGLEPEPEIVAGFAPFRSRGVEVTRLLDRAHFGFDVDLPWLDGGGAYFSFTQRSHDYQSHPQIGVSDGLRTLDAGFYGGADGWVLELGDLPARALFGEGAQTRTWLDARTAQAWDHMLEPIDVSGDVPDAGDFANELNELGFSGFPQVVSGRSYLVRAVEARAFDVLALVQVARVVEGDGLTVAWRVLESREVPNRKATTRASIAGQPDRASLEPMPRDLLQMTPPQRLDELGKIRERGTQLLFTPPPKLQARAAALSSRTDAGIVRLVDRSQPWTEFLHAREGGAYYSFVERSHSYDDEPDISCEDGCFRSGFYGSSTGWFVDLGDVPLDSARGARAKSADAAARFVRTLELPHGESNERFVSAWNEAQARARELGLERAHAVKVERDTTWLLRSVLPEEHDVLAAFRVVASDDYGHFIEWRLLDSWPVPKPR